MLINFMRWIISFVYTPQLTITEDPLKYLEYKLSRSYGRMMYVRKGALYFDIIPPTYDTCFPVSNDMRDIVIDNNIANIRSLIYEENKPGWPQFTGKKPIERWSTPCLLYYSESLRK